MMSRWRHGDIPRRIRDHRRRILDCIYLVLYWYCTSLHNDRARFHRPKLVLWWNCTEEFCFLIITSIFCLLANSCLWLLDQFVSDFQLYASSMSFYYPSGKDGVTRWWMLFLGYDVIPGRLCRGQSTIQCACPGTSVMLLRILSLMEPLPPPTWTWG